MSAFIYSFYPPLRPSTLEIFIGQRTACSRCVTLKEIRPSIQTRHYSEQRDRRKCIIPATSYSIIPTAKYGEENVDDGGLTSWQFAYIITTLITALTGGRALATTSTVFYLIGRVTDAPIWLLSLSTVFVAALTDALLFRIASISADGDVLIPFAIFLAGNAAAAVLDFDSFFRSITPGTRDVITSETTEKVLPTVEEIVHEDSHSSDRNHHNGGGGQERNEFSEWDKLIEKKEPLDGQ